MGEINLTRRNFIKNTALTAISISPVISSLSKILGTTDEKTKLIVSHGFRLTKWENLLNLDFYFINVEFSNSQNKKIKKIFARYSQEESYMIVRLPQQHISEQAYSLLPGEEAPDDYWTAITMISGYSYLVFRIMFDAYDDGTEILLNEESLTDWNQKCYKLVVRQNLTESLFEITTEKNYYNTGNSKTDKENKYPLGYDKQPGGNYTYNYDRFPKAYGDPITALEFPWRLILSPKLPDQNRFIWNWEYSKEPKKDSSGHTEAELWTAALTIVEDPEYLKKIELRKRNQTEEEKENAQKNELDEVIKKIELMIIGSADSTLKPAEKEAIDDIFLCQTYYLKTDRSKSVTKAQYLALNSIEQAKYHCNYEVLPKSKDREQLLELYIKYKLVARTDKITFSPIGVSTFLELKNTKFEKTAPNDLYSWKQLISFGRDEEVEIVRLFIDKEFGHKWLHISTTKRRTKKGLSYLDYREYVMPLEIEKDYTKHQNEKLKDINNPAVKYVTSKFNAPFKETRLLETKPKRILPLKDSTKKEKFGEGHAYIPQVYDKNKDGDHDFIQFQYAAKDWQNQPITFRKNVQAINYGAFEYINSDAVTDKNAEIKKIETLFRSDEIDDLEKKLQNYSSEYKNIAKRFSEIRTDDFKPDEQLSRFKNYITSTKTYFNLPGNPVLPIINAAIVKYLEDFNDTLKVYDEELSNYKTNLKKSSDDLITHINSKIVILDITESEFERKLTTLKDNINAIAEKELSPIRRNLIDRFNELAFTDIRSLEKVKINNLEYVIREKIKESVYDKWLEISKLEDKIPNLIKTYRQKIGYAVEDIKTEEQQLLKGVKNELSNLETDYLVFKGELKRDLESKLDFFNNYASIPQLKQGKAYINSLNKLVNEEFPIGIKYAKDYIDHQIDLNILEVEKNASRLFAEVIESSKEQLKGKIRRVAADMGGYINPEIPVEYLTYLKDPKKTVDKLKNEVEEKFKEEFQKDKEEFIRNHPELQQQYDVLKNAHDDLVFIGHEAKEQWNKIKQVQPDAFFKGLEAKILGSISLKDILGLDFEVPRLSEMPDKIVYNFQTNKIKDKDLSIVKFYAKNKGRPSTLQVYLEKKINNPNEYKSFTKLTDFSIAIKLASEDVLLILFNKLEVSSSNSASKKTDVQIDDVSFGGPLNFLGKLAEAIKMPGAGLRILPSINKIEIGYTFALPSIETPAFNLSNLKFDVGLRIPFPTSDEIKPITTTFSINRPDDKFLVTVGIFGGRGHFVMEATPQKIVSIDASIEFGGYFGINIGIASGQVYLFAGIRYQCSGGDIIFTGYLICGGGVTVFGFISVSVTFVLAMQYQNIGGAASLYGSASVSYCIKIAFFKKSFTLSYSKRISGAEGKPVSPDEDNSSAYIDYNEEQIYYASANDEPTLFAGKTYPDQYQTPADVKSFKTIYPRNSGLWEEHCNSFNF